MVKLLVERARDDVETLNQSPLPSKYTDHPVLYGLNVLARTSPTGVNWKLFALASLITDAVSVAFNNKLTLANNGSVAKLMPRLMFQVMVIVLDLLVVAARAVKLPDTVVAAV